MNKRDDHEDPLAGQICPCIYTWSRFSNHFSHVCPSSSSIINIPGESTLRRDFLRLQLANKERSELIRRQQLEQQQNEEHKRQLLAERQKRIEEQKEQRRRLEEVDLSLAFPFWQMKHLQCDFNMIRWRRRNRKSQQRTWTLLLSLIN